MEPQLGFWSQLVWEMVENTLDEEIEAGGVYERIMRARRGGLRDHDLVTSTKYCEKWLVEENKWQGVNRPYKKQICNNQSDDFNVFIRRSCRITEVIFLCSECYSTHVIDADT